MRLTPLWLCGSHPYLKSQLDFLLAQSAASPFSGATIPAQKPNNKKKKKGTKGGQSQKWGPHGPRTYGAFPSHFAGGTFGAAVTSFSSLEEAHAEIHRLQQFIACSAKQPQCSAQLFWARAGTGCNTYSFANCPLSLFQPDNG
jgi:hypothetical protein